LRLKNGRGKIKLGVMYYGENNDEEPPR